LLEVLIAVTAFAIVLAAINSVFYGALHLRKKTADAVEGALPLQQTVAIIKKDLANIVAPGGMLSGELQSGSTSNQMAGQASPVFYTATAVIDNTSPWAEIQKVSYLLIDSTNRAAGRDLVRAITRNLLPAATQDQPVQQRLMGGVEGIAFLFFDGVQWRDSWDSTTEQTKLPLAIKVQISVAAEEKGRSLLAPVELVVPLAVQPRTNQTAEATGGQP
jgi:type II secretion system protein J